MKLYLGLLENALPNQTRIFTDIDGSLVDLQLVSAAYLAEVERDSVSAYDLAAFYFPRSIAAHLERGTPAHLALEKVISFVHQRGLRDIRGPAGERLVYKLTDLRLLPPLQYPEKSFVIGFSDKARTEAMPKAEIPTGFYKLPQTFINDGAPIVWPNFSEEVDADACLAIVIGKAGKRIPAERAWDYVAGVTLLIDITARDINRREGLTSNNLLGKNFPTSTALGPAVFLTNSKSDLEALEIELSVDGVVKQQFTPTSCVFSVEQIIARWSILGIKPGDWLAIGASMARQHDRLQNPVLLKPGAKIRCSSSAIGELKHEVVCAGEMRR